MRWGAKSRPLPSCRKFTWPRASAAPGTEIQRQLRVLRRGPVMISVVENARLHCTGLIASAPTGTPRRQTDGDLAAKDNRHHRHHDRDDPQHLQRSVAAVQRKAKPLLN